MKTTDGNMEQPNTNTEAAIEAGIGLAEIEKRITTVSIEGIEVPVALVPAGMKLHALENEIKIAESLSAQPRRLRGSSTHTEIESFIAHVNRFKASESAIFADTTNVRLTAVLDYHAPASTLGERGLHDDLARWAGHRSVYTCPLSEQWKLWTGSHGREMSQEAFGQFIEDNMIDLASPTDEDRATFPMPAAVLEMARNLSINVQGEFKKEINPTTGENALINRTEHGPTSTKIPRAFLLGIPVFEAGQPYRVEARLRFFLGSNGPRFKYELYQAEAIKRDAFGQVRAQVTKETALPLFAGSPEQ